MVPPGAGAESVTSVLPGSHVDVPLAWLLCEVDDLA